MRGGCVGGEVGSRDCRHLSKCHNGLLWTRNNRLHSRSNVCTGNQHSNTHRWHSHSLHLSNHAVSVAAYRTCLLSSMIVRASVASFMHVCVLRVTGWQASLAMRAWTLACIMQASAHAACMYQTQRPVPCCRCVTAVAGKHLLPQTCGKRPA